jgi:hypothetical protein
VIESTTPDHTSYAWQASGVQLALNLFNTYTSEEMIWVNISKKNDIYFISSTLLLYISHFLRLFDRRVQRQGGQGWNQAVQPSKKKNSMPAP